jgi:hypothetical protein
MDPLRGASRLAVDWGDYSNEAVRRGSRADPLPLQLRVKGARSGWAISQTTIANDPYEY